MTKGRETTTAVREVWSRGREEGGGKKGGRRGAVVRPGNRHFVIEIAKKPFRLFSPCPKLLLFLYMYVFVIKTTHENG